MTNKIGKTITTYLVNGNPNGIRTCFISNKICKAVVVPRATLLDAKKRDELKQPALYLLLSDTEDKLYIGETEDFLARITQHETKKTFWEQAIIFVSKDNDLTKTDVKYLEFLAITQAKKTARYNIEENKVIPKPTHVPEHQLACIEEFFEDINTLATFLGLPVFNEVKQKNNDLFYIKGKQTDATGFYNDNGFTVLKNSKIPLTQTPSYTNKKSRTETLSKFSTPLNDHQNKLNKDLTFKSPSAAASFCLGRNANGWIAWVNKNELNLDEAYRNKLNEK